MALLGRKSSGLEGASARLHQARAALRDVEAALVQASSERATALGRLAEEADLDVDDLVRRRAEIGLPERDLLAKREALTEQVASLGRRCAALAVEEAEGVVDGLRARLVPLASERERIELRLAEIADEQSEVEAKISEAVDAVRWAAADYDDVAKEAAEAARVQERERVRWIARQSRSRREAELVDDSPRIRRLVEEEIARLASTAEAQRARQRAESEESLRAVGIDPDDLTQARDYPRLRV